MYSSQVGAGASDVVVLEGGLDGLQALAWVPDAANATTATAIVFVDGISTCLMLDKRELENDHVRNENNWNGERAFIIVDAPELVLIVRD